MSYCASYPKQLLFSSLGCVVDGKWCQGPLACLGWEILLQFLAFYWWWGNSGVHACPCHPSSEQLPRFACVLLLKPQTFLPQPFMLFFAMTDLPEMLGDFAICYLRVRKTFFPHGETVTWLWSTPSPSPASSLRNQTITLLTSSFLVLPGSNVNYSSNPTFKWFKVEWLGSKTYRMQVCLWSLAQTDATPCRNPLPLWEKTVTWKLAPRSNPLLIVLI